MPVVVIVVVISAGAEVVTWPALLVVVMKTVLGKVVLQQKQVHEFGSYMRMRRRLTSPSLKAEPLKTTWFSRG